MNGQAAVWRVDLANKQEHEHVIEIVLAFKLMTSQKHKIAIMVTVQVQNDAWGMHQNMKQSNLLKIVTQRLELIITRKKLSSFGKIYQWNDFESNLNRIQFFEQKIA